MDKPAGIAPQQAERPSGERSARVTWEYTSEGLNSEIQERIEVSANAEAAVRNLSVHSSLFR